MFKHTLIAQELTLEDYFKNKVLVFLCKVVTYNRVDDGML